MLYQETIRREREKARDIVSQLLRLITCRCLVRFHDFSSFDHPREDIHRDIHEVFHGATEL